MKICVSGSKGKMGSRIVELSKDDSDLKLSGAFDIGEDATAAIGDCDCLIDFTTPEATIAHLALCEELGKGIVIGSTGLSDADRDKISEASKKIPIVLSPNMSVAVNLLFKMVAQASKVLGPEYHVEVLDVHHVHKKDSPSGTANEIVRIVKELKGDDNIQIDSVREGETVGEHTVTFDSDVDTIEITHSAKTRDIFAKGALRAAKWLMSKPHGLYTMREVLGL